MPSDISRSGESRPYQGVVMQQGRVILDRDYNALRDAIDRRIELDALDFVGPCGTPDDGFRIGPPDLTGSPPLWIPPAPLSPPASGMPGDFSISAGTMYVGGQRAAFAPARFGQPSIGYSYFDQPDWVCPAQPSDNLSHEFIYLDLLQQEVSAVEDPDLIDVALGGPDTTQRLRLLQRVKRLAGDSADCDTARTEAVQSWLDAGLAFDPDTMRLLPQASLLVSFASDTSTNNLCDPVAQGGYLGADNQVIRVQITDGGVGAAPTLLWGYDNASALYRVSVSNASTKSATALTLGEVPVDAYHVPQPGQVVEVLRTALIIESDSDETSPGQSGKIVRCVAESSGIVCSVVGTYQPDTQSITLNQALPDAYLHDTNPLFLRIWQSQVPFTFDGKTAAELTDGNGNTTGLLVTLGAPQGNTQKPPIGAYWMLAVRPSTPQAVYPQRLLISPQPPDGPQRWVCPLGTIDWLNEGIDSPPTSPVSFGPAFHDCRQGFDNLVTLTKRKQGGCCSVTVRPEDLAADPLALQNAVEQFRWAAGGAAICLTPGNFLLSQPLRLGAAHAGITIEACHGAVTLQAPSVDNSAFIDGLVVLTQTNDITFRGITFQPSAVDLASAIPSNNSNTNLTALIASLSDPQMFVAIRLVDCTELKIRECQFVFQTVGSGNFGAGILAHGDCTGLSVRQCGFTGSPQVLLEYEVRTSVQEELAPAATKKAAAAPAAKLKAASRTQAAATAAKNSKNAVLDAAVAKTPSYLAVEHLLQSSGITLDPALLQSELTGPVFAAPTTLPNMITALLMTPRIDAAFDYTKAKTPIGGIDQNLATLLAGAVLDQAEFIDNRMQSLDVAILASAITGAVTFSGNTCTDCSGGIWMACLSQSIVSDAGVFQILAKVIPPGTYAATALALAMWYPLPIGASPSTEVQALSPRLQVVNNRIDAFFNDGTFSGPACLIEVMVPLRATGDPNASILLNSNQLQNRSNPAAPIALNFAATAALIGAYYTIVGSNLIRNLSAASNGDDKVRSLVVNGASAGTTSSTGNILVGSWSVKP